MIIISLQRRAESKTRIVKWSLECCWLRLRLRQRQRRTALLLPRPSWRGSALTWCSADLSSAMTRVASTWLTSRHQQIFSLSQFTSSAMHGSISLYYLKTNPTLSENTGRLKNFPRNPLCSSAVQCRIQTMILIARPFVDHHIKLKISTSKVWSADTFWTPKKLKVQKKGQKMDLTWSGWSPRLLSRRIKRTPTWEYLWPPAVLCPGETGRQDGAEDSRTKEASSGHCPEPEETQQVGAVSGSGDPGRSPWCRPRLQESQS